MRTFAKHRSAVLGALVLFAVIVLALLAPVLPLADPNAIPKGAARLGPSGAHWFGTDQLGRDLLSRIVFGARPTLFVAVLATALATFIGVIVGTAAGWCGRVTDSVLMRSTEIVLAFPSVLFAAALVVALGRSTWTVILVLALTSWPVLARTCRASVMGTRRLGFVEASMVMGSSSWRTISRHVLPHALLPVSVLAVMTLATSILAEAALSFLGVGVDATAPSWGVMLYEGKRFLVTDPHLVLAPALAVGVTVAAVVLIADGVREALHLDD